MHVHVQSPSYCYPTEVVLFALKSCLVNSLEASLVTILFQVKKLLELGTLILNNTVNYN